MIDTTRPRGLHRFAVLTGVLLGGACMMASAGLVFAGWREGGVFGALVFGGAGALGFGVPGLVLFLGGRRIRAGQPGGARIIRFGLAGVPVGLMLTAGLFGPRYPGLPWRLGVTLGMAFVIMVLLVLRPLLIKVEVQLAEHADSARVGGGRD